MKIYSTVATFFKSHYSTINLQITQTKDFSKPGYGNNRDPARVGRNCPTISLWQLWRFRTNLKIMQLFGKLFSNRAPLGALYLKSFSSSLCFCTMVPIAPSMMTVLSAKVFSRPQPRSTHTGFPKKGHSFLKNGKMFLIFSVMKGEV